MSWKYYICYWHYSIGLPGSSDWLEDLLEKEMATHASILAWRIPWTEEPGGLSPWVPKRRHDQVTKHTCFALFLFLYLIKSSLPNPKQQSTYI